MDDRIIAFIRERVVVTLYDVCEEFDLPYGTTYGRLERMRRERKLVKKPSARSTGGRRKSTYRINHDGPSK